MSFLRRSVAGAALELLFVLGAICVMRPLFWPEVVRAVRAPTGRAGSWFSWRLPAPHVRIRPHDRRRHPPWQLHLPRHA